MNPAVPTFQRSGRKICFRILFKSTGNPHDPSFFFLLDHKCSVADPGCLSPILIFTFPGSRIQKQKQKRGVKKFVVIPFFVATNFTQLFYF
jgi:hypothetical protein